MPWNSRSYEESSDPLSQVKDLRKNMTLVSMDNYS